MLLTCIFVLALPILAAIVLQNYMFAGLTAPPSDYGKGSMFDELAVRYDMINRILAVGMDIGWRQRMVEKIRDSPLVVAATATATTTATESPLHPPTTMQLLDVATGTADVALLLARAIPTANITGVDPSENMLHIGRQKVAQQQLNDRIKLAWHDAQDLTSLSIDRQHVFDGATMAFGIRNVPNRERALCQIHGLLKPNAVLCILEFSEPDPATTGVMGAAARLFIRHVIPVLGGLLSGKPREYWHLQSSIQDFPTPNEFVKLLEGLDCGGDQESNDKSSSIGAFRVEELVQMNFGSVQLYVATAIH
jgi:demethylmenaquinone methyltransferase / 2-methoxy-6-polyprenyl-1,4-benzoquinol methylase